MDFCNTCRFQGMCGNQTVGAQEELPGCFCGILRAAMPNLKHISACVGSTEHITWLDLAVLSRTGVEVSMSVKAAAQSHTHTHTHTHTQTHTHNTHRQTHTRIQASSSIIHNALQRHKCRSSHCKYFMSMRNP